MQLNNYLIEQSVKSTTHVVWAWCIGVVCFFMMLRRHRLIVQGEVTALLSAMRGAGTGGRWIEISKSNAVIKVYLPGSIDYTIPF